MKRLIEYSNSEDVYGINFTSLRDTGDYDDVIKIIRDNSIASFVERKIIYAGWHETIEESIFSIDDYYFKVYLNDSIGKVALILLCNPTIENKNILRSIAEKVIAVKI
ncbi:MAG: hypothetical protein WBP45_10815 [Daejeonella sp.]